MLPAVNAIWIGKAMGPAHAACLRSFIRTDHRVVLHTYGHVSDAPEGVVYADANALVPEDKLIRHRATGSFSLVTNMMRYELLRRGLGMYVDCDVYCLRPMEDRDTIFGRESHDFLNSAVLKLPADSPILTDLCAIKEGWVRPWQTAAEATKPPPALADLPWGSIGPKALTWYVKKRNYEWMAEPFDVFYPVPHDRWEYFYDPGLRIEDLVTHRTRYVHLYHQASLKSPREIPRTSPLGWMVWESE